MKIPQARAPHRFDLNLVVTSWLVERNRDPELATFTGLGYKSHRLRPAAKHDCADRGVFILYGEIPVSRRGLREVGDLPFEPNPAERRLQKLTHAPVELCDGQYRFVCTGKLGNGWENRVHRRMLSTAVIKVQKGPKHAPGRTSDQAKPYKYLTKP